MIAKKITNSSNQPGFQVLANRGRRTWVGSEAALETALANDELTEGTVADTYVEGNTVQSVTPEYVRQQNVLSDYEPITIGTSYDTAYECQYDGFITITGFATAPNDLYIYVNNVSLGHEGISSGSFVLSLTALVRKGDKVHTNLKTNSAFGTFYKLRDYEGRT